MEAYYPETTMGWCGVVAALVLFFLFLWSRREDRRTKAMKAAAQFRAWGIDGIADLLEAYAIGNYLGHKSVVRTIRKLVQRAQEESIPVMFSKATGKLINYKLQTVEGREEIAEKLRIAEDTAKLEKPAVEDPTPDVDID